jgi:glycerol-1-phosphate dehydrogenase [NAD(P)+]
MLTAPVETLPEHLRAALRLATDTRALALGDDALASTGAVFHACFGHQAAVLVADRNTFPLAGSIVTDQLRQTCAAVREPFIFDEPQLPASYARVETLRALLRRHDAIPVAIGSGTINDITKLAAHQAGRRYMVVATAPSMDGYTAYGASITRAGLKQTFHCPAPAGLVADTGLIRTAPAQMRASGYADLLAKITAGADWLLADALGVEPVDPHAWSLVQPRLRAWLADPAAVRANEGAAIARLTEGLIMAGLAMQACQSSRPASGAEHQFSHLWDMQGHTCQGAAPSHGFKVGIGTLAVAALYAQLLSLKPDAWDAVAATNAWPSRATCVQRARARHSLPHLQELAASEVGAKYVPADAIGERIERLRAQWPDLRQRLAAQLLPATTLRSMLATVGAPTDPDAIGIANGQLRDSFFAAQTIRRRYTVLDLAHEAGILDAAIRHICSYSS